MARLARTIPNRPKVYRRHYYDVIAPTVSAGAPSVAKISRVASKDATVVTFSVDEAVQGWQVRLVPSTGSTYTQGTLIESGGALAASTNQDVEITDDELVNAGGVEGTNTIKIFAQDLEGNWSS